MTFSKVFRVWGCLFSLNCELDFNFMIYPGQTINLMVKHQGQKLRYPLWFILLCLCSGASLSRQGNWLEDYEWSLNFNEIATYDHCFWIGRAWGLQKEENPEEIAGFYADLDDIPF